MAGSLFDFTMQRLDGSEQSLSDFRGKVLLLVNVASYCGNTPQYEGLQRLHSDYQAQGFEVLGFPANDFGAQEPGKDREIAHFCETQYGVTFPLFSKITVKGGSMHPLYQLLTSQPDPVGGDVTWNFQKFLVDRDGNVVAKFAPRTQPQSAEVVSAIEQALE